MLTLPQIVQRPAQPYVFVPYTVRMNQMKEPGDKGMPQLFAFLQEQGVAPAGAPFYNYRRINMAETLDVEVGVPVVDALAGGGTVQAGMLPGGRFASLQWHGHYDALETVTTMLLGWARLIGERLDMHEGADGDHFACRLEIYENDPGDVPDPKDWVTTLMFKLVD